MTRIVMVAVTRLEYFIADLSRAIWILRAPVVVSIIAFWILSHDQLREVYVSLANQGRGWPVFWACMSLAALSLLLFGIGRELAARRAVQDHSRKSTHGLALRYLSASFGVVPLASVACGLYLAGRPLREYAGYQRLALIPGSSSPEIKEFLANLAHAMSNAKQTVHDLDSAFYLFFALTVVVAILALWQCHRSRAGFAIPRVRFFLFPPIALCVVFLGISIFLAAYQTDPSFGPYIIDAIRGLGAIFIVNLFLSFLGFFFAAMVLWRDRRGVPILTLLLGLALLSSYYNWNDNHVVRLMEVDSNLAGAASNPPMHAAVSAALPALPVAFFDWFDRRPERRRCMFSATACNADTAEAAARRPAYPVYIVAAEGGGMYAAELAAIAMARLYDRCPALKHHIFAVSGVSGGSVGAGVFAALLNSASGSRGRASQDDPEKCDFGNDSDQRNARNSVEPAPGSLESRAVRFLSDDFLSPLGAAGLFPDFFQRFLPYPIGAFDRARAFEASLERTWVAKGIGTGPNPLQEGFLSHWRPDGDAPMLVLNTTSVQTGQPVVVAPFLTRSFGIDYGGEISSIYERLPARNNGRLDLSLSSAISLSSRYPLVLPSGSFIGRAEHRFRLADGGYFENSGVETALLMVRDLQFFTQYAQMLHRERSNLARANNYEKIDFRLLVLNGWGGNPPADEGLNELLTPVRALYRARVQRGEIAINRAQTSGVQTRVVRFDHDLFSLALGWQLSDQTYRLISLQISRPEWCIEDERLMKQKLGDLKSWQTRHPNIKGFETIFKRDNKRLAKLYRLRNDNACALRSVIDHVKL